MNSISHAVAAIAIAALSAGCSKGGGEPGSQTKPETAPASATAKSGGAHAPTNVKPGSHEDWCGEHEVPESQCTRCSPDLAPAFKATGDWCPEHGLPESQCKKCNPEVKIVRPPKGS